jgi:hypothetical protein
VMDPDNDAIEDILELLEGKAGDLMKEKHGPKPEDGAAPLAHGHVVTVTVKPHHPGAPGEDAAPPADESGLTADMLKELLGHEGDDEEK